MFLFLPSQLTIQKHKGAPGQTLLVARGLVAAGAESYKPAAVIHQ
jgi:hypothetical protein